MFFHKKQTTQNQENWEATILRNVFISPTTHKFKINHQTYSYDQLLMLSSQPITTYKKETIQEIVDVKWLNVLEGYEMDGWMGAYAGIFVGSRIQSTTTITQKTSQYIRLFLFQDHYFYLDLPIASLANINNLDEDNEIAIAQQVHDLFYSILTQAKPAMLTTPIIDDNAWHEISPSISYCSASKTFKINQDTYSYADAIACYIDAKSVLEDTIYVSYEKHKPNIIMPTWYETIYIQITIHSDSLKTITIPISQHNLKFEKEYQNGIQVAQNIQSLFTHIIKENALQILDFDKQQKLPVFSIMQNLQCDKHNQCFIINKQSVPFSTISFIAPGGNHEYRNIPTFENSDDYINIIINKKRARVKKNNTSPITTSNDIRDSFSDISIDFHLENSSIISYYLIKDVLDSTSSIYYEQLDIASALCDYLNNLL
ncbi:MAG: hypothetical protein RSC10_09150 [Longicatena sp.]